MRLAQLTESRLLNWYDYISEWWFRTISLLLLLLWLAAVFGAFFRCICFIVVCGGSCIEDHIFESFHSSSESIEWATLDGLKHWIPIADLYWVWDRWQKLMFESNSSLISECWMCDEWWWYAVWAVCVALRCVCPSASDSMCNADCMPVTSNSNRIVVLLWVYWYHWGDNKDNVCMPPPIAILN